MYKNKNRKQKRFFTHSLVLVTVLFGLVLTTPKTFADESIVDVVTVSVPISCSMSASVTSEHTASIHNGQTTENIGATNLKVFCNDNSGYAIYAIGYTENTYGNNKLTNDSLGSTFDIETSSTITANTSSWAMKLASVSGDYAPTIVSDFTSYHAIPEEYTKVASYTTSTDAGANANGSNLTTTYRAHISPSQPAGIYVGQVKYTLVHPQNAPSNTYTINFNANGGSGTMSRQIVYTDEEPVSLNANTFTREGYAFAGWCTTNTSETSCTDGTLYADEKSVSGLVPNGESMNLWAVWMSFAMQDFTLDNCKQNVGLNGNIAKVGDEITVYDRRDQKNYTVRYINGNCWMTENLRVSGTITAELSNFETSPYSGDDTINLLAGGDFKDVNSTFTAPMMHLADADDVETAGFDVTTEQLGAWYNYCAASAGQVCAKTQTNATQDICPSGWKMPTGGGGSSMHQLLANFVGTNLSIFKPVAAGGYYNTELLTAGTAGYYWSSSARSTTNHWDIYSYNGRLNVGNIGGDYGISVRCVRSN